MKDRFGRIVRALNLYAQSVESPSMRICYNMTFKWRLKWEAMIVFASVDVAHK